MLSHSSIFPFSPPLANSATLLLLLPPLHPPVRAVTPTVPYYSLSSSLHSHKQNLHQTHSSQFVSSLINQSISRWVLLLSDSVSRSVVSFRLRVFVFLFLVLICVWPLRACDGSEWIIGGVCVWIWQVREIGEGKKLWRTGWTMSMTISSRSSWSETLVSANPISSPGLLGTSSAWSPNLLLVLNSPPGLFRYS